MLRLHQDKMERWVAALRSGTYTQGKCHLRTIDDKWDPLGVLTDLWIQETDGVDWKLHVSGEYFCVPDRFPGMGGSIPPADVAHWAGVALDLDYWGAWKITTPEGDMSVTFLSDCGLYNFDQIATLIEENAEIVEQAVPA